MGKQNTKLTVEGFVSGCEWLDCVKGSFCQTDVYSISSLTNNKQIDTMKELLTIADAKFGVYKKKAFAEILGITNDRFLKICSGDEQPSTNDLTKISECLGVAFYIKGSEIRVVLDATDNPHLHKTEAMRCFTFYKSDEYPSGAIKISKEDAFKLQEIGWTVNFHTEYYLNFIGCNFNGLEIGFCNWMSNLDASISTPEVGYYSDCWGENVKFKSQDCLDVFVDTISNLVWLSKNNA